MDKVLQQTSETVPLSSIKPGESGVIVELQFSADYKLRFVEMGFVPGEHIRLIRRAPWGGPVEVEIMGIRHGIRLSDAAMIQMTKTTPKP